jgi:hypothetical protein
MKWLKRIVIALVVILVVIQVIRPAHSNPPVDAKRTIFATGKVPPDVHAIIDRSCNDCHTHTVVWPWYSNVAPASWLVAKDVRDGRKQLDLSTWGTSTPRRQAHKLEELCDQVKQGDMPPKYYLWMHSGAKLSDGDRGRLCDWATGLQSEIIAAHPEAVGKKG